MDRRGFLRTSSMAALGLAARQESHPFRSAEKKGAGKLKNWAWITTDLKTDAESWKQKFEVMRKAGIHAVIPEVYNGRHSYFASRHLPTGGEWLEQLLPLARSAGLEVHAWMWSMPCNIPEMAQKHPDWFAVNGLGESAAVKPAYVPYYKFMCPTHPEVQEFVRSTVAELGRFESLAGIHLDYIRFPDVILAEGLQPRYKIVQDREYPQYDYCYCERCRQEFQEKFGSDPLKLPDPSANSEWRQFRYDRVTHLVNQVLAPAARRAGKQVTAAVFPNWQHVRQQWPVWKLDGVLPMLYHRFYNQDIAWIQEQTVRGVKSLEGRTPLYSGLFVPDLAPESLAEAVKASLAGGAAGISLFAAGSMKEGHWELFGRLMAGLS